MTNVFLSGLHRFQKGAFYSGEPILPVCIVYPWKHFNPSWANYPALKHIFKTASQLVTHVTVRLGDIYIPSAQEKEDPELYANNVQVLSNRISLMSEGIL